MIRSPPDMAKVAFRYLDRAQVAALMPPPEELVRIVAEGLAAHGKKDVVMPPKAHIDLDERYNGHFNVLPGWAGHIDCAGVKVTGDYVDNWRRGLPSEAALVTLYDPRCGVPLAVMDATHITAWRTGAVTAAGAGYLAPARPRILGHIGARGSAFPNVALLASQYTFDEVRIHSKRPESRVALAERARRELGVNARAVDDVKACVRDADIVVEATRLEKPTLLVRDELTRDMVHADIGQIVAGVRPGRTSSDERIVFWHRGFAVSDIVVAHTVLARAECEGVGILLTLFDIPDE